MQQQQDRQYNNRRQKSRQERDSFPTVWQSSVFNNVLSWSAMFIAFDNLVWIMSLCTDMDNPIAVLHLIRNLGSLKSEAAPKSNEM